MTEAASPAHRHEVAFLDRVSAWSVLALVWRARRTRSVYYFDPPRPSALGLAVLRLAIRVGLAGPAAPVAHHIGQAADEHGRSLYLRTLLQAGALTARVRHRWLLPARLMAALEPDWPRAKVAFHLDRLVEADVRRECLRLQLARWLLAREPGAGVVLLSSVPWRGELESYAGSLGIGVRWYRVGPDPSAALRSVAQVAGLALGIGRRIGRSAGPAPAPSGGTAATTSGRATLGLGYGHRSLAIGAHSRSEFFWLGRAARAARDVLLYGYTAPTSIAPDVALDLAARGIRISGRAPGISRWRPRRKLALLALASLGRLARAATSELVRLRPPSGWLVRKLAALCVEHAYWYDFFAANHVRVNVVTMEGGSVAQVLALDQLGGISCAYQVSASGLSIPVAYVSAGETVQFVFSEEYAQLLRAAEVPAERVIVAGFIYDAAIDALRGSSRSRELRRGLEEQGARFVLCFFDENSASRWDITASDDEATEDYAQALRWVLEDPSLGLIVKVKKAGTLLERIRPVAALLERATATGRCLLMRDEGSLSGTVYPAEAALAADLCVGKLQGATAGLEARLSGVPTILIGAPHLWDHPLHEWLGPEVVYPAWEDARRAIEAFRRDPEAHRAVGDWSKGIDRLDPHRDGRAAARIDGYVAALLEAIGEGLSRTAALERADAELEVSPT